VDSFTRRLQRLTSTAPEEFHPHKCLNIAPEKVSRLRVARVVPRGESRDTTTPTNGLVLEAKWRKGGWRLLLVNVISTTAKFVLNTPEMITIALIVTLCVALGPIEKLYIRSMVRKYREVTHRHRRLWPTALATSSSTPSSESKSLSKSRSTGICCMSWAGDLVPQLECDRVTVHIP
jgi:hypothetical protein